MGVYREPPPSRRRLLLWSVAGAAGVATAGSAAAPTASSAGPVTPQAPPRPAASTPAAPRPAVSATAPAPTGGGADAVVRQPARHVRELLPDAPAGAVALTLDDGPHPTWTPRMLDVLRTHQVLATFCLVGDQARAHPALVRAILAAGHSLCNHTMTHPQPFSRRPRAQLRAEISGAQQAIIAAGGLSPRLFRAPGGDWSPDVLAVADELGLTPLGWDVDPRDWSRPGEEVIVRALSAARAGDILLSHDGGGDRSQTVAALDRVLPALRARGCVFVAL